MDLRLGFLKNVGRSACHPLSQRRMLSSLGTPRTEPTLLLFKSLRLLSATQSLTRASLLSSSLTLLRRVRCAVEPIQ